jgi:prepilin-type N-terminal cleavage/methylation domain-containing protein
MQLITTIKLNTPNKNGFTLIEVMSVIVIMSVMLSVGIKKLDVLSKTAADRVLENVVRELNARETLVWTKIKLSDSGWTNDADVFAQIDKDLGSEFDWAVEPNDSGGTLQFRSRPIILKRIASTNASVGRWD